MKRFHRYVPESDDLAESRFMESIASWRSVREAASDRADLIKDYCQFVDHDHSIVISERCMRRGVPVVFSHKYDA